MSNRYFLVYDDVLTFVISSKQHFKISIVYRHPLQPGVSLLLYCTISALPNPTSLFLRRTAYYLCELVQSHALRTDIFQRMAGCQRPLYLASNGTTLNSLAPSQIGPGFDAIGVS